MTPVLRDLVAVMEEIAPTAYAESWDNVGLLAGDPAQSVSNVLLTIDYTAVVAAEAAEQRCDAVIAYHPPIFSALKRITASSLIFDAIRRGIALYSPHTALDVADGGTNDMLADAIGLAEPAPLRVAPGKASEYKLVTFVPEKDVERLSQALFAAGAGHIGKYACCSFRSPGNGTFFGEEGTNPAVGQSGRLEVAPEIRLETIIPINRVNAIITALREAHPYEEPAFDLVQLAAPPVARGMGRFGKLAAPATRREVIERIKAALELSHVLAAGPLDAMAQTAAVGAGACGDLLEDALARKVDVYLTGEMRHHDALRAAQAGMTVVCTLHSNSERAVLKRLQTKLRQRLPEIQFAISRCDRDPFSIR